MAEFLRSITFRDTDKCAPVFYDEVQEQVVELSFNPHRLCVPLRAHPMGRYQHGGPETRLEYGERLREMAGLASRRIEDEILEELRRMGHSV